MNDLTVFIFIHTECMVTSKFICCPDFKVTFAASIEMSPQKRKVMLKFLLLLAVLFSEPQFNINVASAIIKTSGEQEEIRNNHSVLQVERADRYSKLIDKKITRNENINDHHLISDPTAPMEYVLDDNLEISETNWQPSRQVIQLRYGTPKYKAVCVKNCYPASVISDVEKEIIYQVKCVENCPKNSKVRFRWTLNAPGFKFDRDTKFGQENEFLHIKPNVLEPGKQLRFAVSIIGGGKVSDGVIKTHISPKLQSCKIVPAKGYAFTTRFHISCNINPGKYTFKLFGVSPESEALFLTSGKNLNEMPLLLHTNTPNVMVRIFDEYEFTDYKILEVNVEDPPPRTGDFFKEIELKYFHPNATNSIPYYLVTNNTEFLLQLINALTEELSNKLLKDNKTAGSIKHFDKRILNNLEKVSPDTKEEAMQILSVSSRIADHYEQKSDPDMAEQILSICKDASDKYSEFLQQQELSHMNSEEIAVASRHVAKCSKVISDPNFEIFQTEDNFEVPTTPYPLIEIPIIKEDYPDYVDDQNLSKVLTKYQSSANDLISQCYVQSKSVALSLNTYDDTKSDGTDYFRVTATKKLGSDIPYVTISSQDVNLTASKDFIQYAEMEVNVLLCTTTKNPFWWIGGEIVKTTIAILSFYVDDKVISSFVKPFPISFKNNEENFSSIIVHTATTPRHNVIENQEISDFERIAMFRIVVFRKQSYVIEFLDLAPSENFNVYVSDFVKPSPQEFREKSMKISRNNGNLFIPYKNDYDSWHYLCVLPHESMGALTLLLKFRVYTMACYHWKSSIRNWEFACGAAATSNLERFECLCHESSVISGRLRRNNVSEEISTQFFIHELEFQENFVIFISVAVAFFLYCVLLIFITITSKKNTGKSIYFLSDNPRSFLYGYIVIVKTGHGSNAGTSSNVVFKLYGKNSESKKHVLNSPDPKKIILQRNQEDWFFLATEEYLGEIEKLDVWFNSLGFRPSWYCSEIEVVDLQMNRYWWFNMKYRFEICEKENHFITAVPEIPRERTYKNTFALKKFSMHGCHMWNIFRDEEIDFSRTKRLTIMLSIFMTTCTVIMFLYGCPTLQDSDSIGPYFKYGFHIELVWITICGLTITFLIHFPFVYFFRNYHVDRNVEDKKKPLVTPAQIQLICWCLLVFLIIATMTLLVIFGFWVQDITALLWLTSTGASLLIYIILLENCVKLVHNLTMKGTNRLLLILSRLKPALAHVEAQRKYIFKSFGQVALRPQFKRLYKPLGRSRIRRLKRKAIIKQNILELLEDLVMMTIYVLLLYIVILKDKDPITCLSNQEVRDLVVGIHSRTKPKITPISNRKEIEEYITNTAIFSMQSLQWYGKFVSDDPGMTIDNHNKYIGIARLRQLRSHNESCTVVSPMDFLWKECVHGYSDGPEYGDFSEGWKNDVLSDTFERTDSMWNYMRYSITGSFSYVGKFATYPGGGYVANLGRTLKNSLINARYIFRNNWIDKFTRCLFMEVLLYNSNSNLFHSVMVKFEMSTTGFVRPLFTVTSARLLFVTEKVGVLLWIVMASFVLMVLLLLLKLLFKIVRKKKMIFRDLWHIVDIIIITMSLTCSHLYLERSTLVKSFLTKIEHAKHNEFVNYTQLFFAETIFTSMAAILIFLATLRLWKLMKFLLIIKITEKTMALSVAPLACAMLQHMLTLFLFTLVGLIFFGDQSFDFKDILDSLLTLLLLSLCFNEMFEFGALKTPLHQLYYSMYMLISLYYFTVYIAIITISYAEAELYYSNEESYGVLEYLKEQYQYYKSVAKIKLNYFSHLRGGQDRPSEEKPVFPKADEYRYANCLALPRNKMNAMLYATRGVLRSMKKKEKRPVLTKDDENLMKMIIVNFFRKDSKKHDYFFIGTSHSRKAKVVDDLVLQKMEKVLTILMTGSDTQREKLYEGLLESNKKITERMSTNLSVLVKCLGGIEIKRN